MNEDKCKTCAHRRSRCNSEFMYSICLTEGYDPDVHGEGFPYSLYEPDAEAVENAAIEGDCYVNGRKVEFDPLIADYERSHKK